jgi:hypothetical protein
VVAAAVVSGDEGGEGAISWVPVKASAILVATLPIFAAKTAENEESRWWAGLASSEQRWNEKMGVLCWWGAAE